jgi:peptidylprolyl isomerase
MRLRKSLIVSLLALASAGFVSCGPDTRDLPEGLYAVISTGKGEIVIQLEPDRAPLTTMNFVGLAEGSIDSNADGKPFYDGLTFHRVEPGFVIQGGDPDGRGTGGPGYRFPTETHPDLLHDAAGTVAMANSGPDTNGSQFYITMNPTPHLDGGYNVFGRVIRGMETVTSIAVGDTMDTVEIVRVGDAAGSYEPSTERFRQLVEQLTQRRAAAAESRQREAARYISATWPNAVEIGGDGLLLDPTRAGGQRKPVAGDRVTMNFAFELLDGTTVDDTKLDEPFTFVLGQDRLLPGLELAVAQIGVGGSATAIIPPELAFGAAGVPPVVQPNSYVVFRIEIVAIE